ncbi:MAG TPA: MarR family transcriptional regulator [Streptosporangiaceae bacterium]|nr:MarR family transcriptional regulator [Streptosporangiaceae bacterium]
MTEADLSELSTPTLMRAARGVYARSIRAHLDAIGAADLPRNGVFLLAGIDDGDGARQDLPDSLGVSKQAVSQVVDVLVNRGYVTRSPDTGDRRRVALALTDRGREVLAAAARGVAAVDAQLAERVTAAQLEGLRASLAALAGIKVADTEAGTGRRRPERQLRSFSPIFPVRDLAAALAHYAALGFETIRYEGGAAYGFANRDRTSLHLAAHAEHDPEHNNAEAYLYVRDADALYAEWTRPGVGGHTHPVGPTAYQLREGSHIDPDGNLIRFGSPMDED